MTLFEWIATGWMVATVLLLWAIAQVLNRISGAVSNIRDQMLPR